MASEQDKKKLDENLKYLQEREKDLHERVEEFSQQKEKQRLVNQDVKEKEQELISLKNEVNSQSKLLNMANQQIPIKEKRVKELDDIIKEKEARINELNQAIDKSSNGPKEMEAKIKELTQYQQKSLDLEEQLKEREQAIDSYKKKIIAMEFKEEDSKKTIALLENRLIEFEQAMKSQRLDYDQNYKKIQDVEDVGVQTVDIKIKDISKKDKQKSKSEMISELQANAEAEKQAFLKQIKDLQDFVSKQNINIDSLEKANHLLQQQLDSQKSQQKTLQSQLEQYQSDYQLLQQQLEAQQTSSNNNNGLSNTQQLELQIKCETEKEETDKMRQQLQKIEAKNREKEVKLAQTEQRLNQIQIQSNEYKLSSDALQQKCDQQSAKIKEQKVEIRTLTQDKEDLENALSSKKQKYSVQNQQIKMLEEELQKRDQEIDNKAKVLTRLMQSNEDLNKENKKISLKLRQIQTTQVKDMQRKIRDKESENEVLKEMLRSAQLQNKGKDNEIQRLQKKIARMAQEGYVDKIKAFITHKNNHIDNTNADIMHGTFNEKLAEDDNNVVDEEDFYDNSQLEEMQDSIDEIRPVRVKVISGQRNQEFSLPDISQKSGSSQITGLGNRRSMKDLHNNNIIYDHDIDDQNMSRKQLLKSKRQEENQQSNKIFESQYNQLVDEYSKVASQRELKFNSSGMTGVMSTEVSPDMMMRKLNRNQANYQSLENLRGIGKSQASTISGTKSKQGKLINILEEKSDYLVISPPRLNR